MPWPGYMPCKLGLVRVHLGQFLVHSTRHLNHIGCTSSFRPNLTNENSILAAVTNWYFVVVVVVFYSENRIYSYQTIVGHLLRFSKALFRGPNLSVQLPKRLASNSMRSYGGSPFRIQSARYLPTPPAWMIPYLGGER